MPDEPIQRPYCLYCYAPMQPFREASAHCEVCQRVNLHLDQSVYWTREKDMVDLEIVAKTTLVVVLGSFSGVMLFSYDGGGTGQGWAAGMPVLFGAYAWDTASKLTRESPYLKASIVWSIALAPMGFLLAWPALAYPGWNPVARLLLVVVGATCFLAAFLAPFTAGWFERWKRRRIRTRRERALRIIATR